MRQHPRPSWWFGSPTRTFMAVLFVALAAFGSATPVSAQVAANQLCQAAGYGVGCIGAFRPHGMSVVRPGVSPGVNVGGMMGGIFASLVAELVLDAVMSEIANQGAPSSDPATPDRVEALQQSVDQQRRFQEEREQQLVASMLDPAASRLADGTTDMTLLERDAAEAGRVFDRGSVSDPNTVWMARHDAWFSTEVVESTGAQPLPLSQQPLEYSPEQLDPIQCGGPSPYGGQLCAFPQMKGPAVTLKVVPPARPTPGVPAPPSVPAPPADAGVVPLKSETAVAPILGTGAPDPPPVGRLPDRETPSTGICEEAPVFEHDGVFVAGARRRMHAIAKAQEDPRTYTDILTTAIIKKARALPELQGTMADTALKAYGKFMGKLTCQTFEVLTDALMNPQAALQKSDALLQGAPDMLQDAVMDSIPGGKITRLALTGRVEEAVAELKQQVKDDLLDAGKDRVKATLQAPLEKAPGWVKDATKETLDAADKWLVGDELSRLADKAPAWARDSAGRVIDQTRHWMYSR